MTTQAKILLAEDESIASHYLSISLARMGYEITGTVQTGEEVLATVTENPPDLILMDITLGGKIDGITAAQSVHERFDMPVIYITANTDSEVFERAKTTDPYAYIIKPYELSQLQNTIEITLLKHGFEKKLKESENWYRTLFEVSDNAMMLIDEHSNIIMVNDQFRNMTGYSGENRMSWTDFFDGNELIKLEKRLQPEDNSDTKEKHHFESILTACDGSTRVVYTNVKKIPGTGTRIISMNDISELKLAEREIRMLNSELGSINKGLKQEISLRERVERQLRYKATHDHLTGLPNRVLLFDRMKQAFAFEARHNTLIALMILDLDNFKSINDTMGHLSGDILLKKVALCLQQCMRQYDTVGRLGGDEFVIIINDAGTIQDITAFAEKVKSAFQEPFDILGQQVYVTTSIGVAVYPIHGSNIESLLKKADSAMYVAKKDGRNTFRFYSDSMEETSGDVKHRMRTERRIDLMEKASLNSLIQKSTGKTKKDQLAH